MGLADCDPKATCVDMTHGYTCKCQHGFVDKSPDPINKPGRICSKCSPFLLSPITWSFLFENQKKLNILNLRSF